MTGKNIPVNQDITPENQENAKQVENPAESKFKQWLKDIWTTVIWWLAALQIGLSAQAWELPKWYEEKAQAGKEIVIDQSAEKTMLDNFAKLPQQERVVPNIIKYSSLPTKDKDTVTQYYTDNPDKLPKCTFQLINLLHSIQENFKFREKFSLLIVDWKFIGDKKIVDEIKSLPQSLWWIYNILLKLDPNIKNLFWDNFEEFITVLDKTNMLFSKIIDETKKQDLASEKKLVKALEESNELYKKFLEDFKKAEWTIN